MLAQLLSIEPKIFPYSGPRKLDSRLSY
jgi:hypothetical protein